MKKQLFILIVAIFAMNFSNVFGQATNGSAPRPILCTDDALHPIAGKSYNYSAVVNPTGGNFQWWAQKGTNFITSGTNTIATRLTVAAGALVTTSSNYGTASATDNVSITWASSTLAGTSYPSSPTFVAVQYDAPVTGCSNNLKIFKIEPVFAFVVDIKNVNHATLVPKAYDAAENQCVSPVAGANYNATTDTMEMDYGSDTLYFEVVAANFTSYWIPSFKLSGLLTGQAASMGWFYSGAITGTPDATYTSQNGTTGDTLTFSNTTHVNVLPATNTNLGVSIYVRVIVQNNRNENLAGQNITIAVEGANADGNADIANSTCAAPTKPYEDLAMQTVDQRPTVGPGTGTNFIPQAP